MRVRPSWIRVRADGRKSEIATGPRSRDGELLASFSARIDGAAIPFLDVRAVPDDCRQSVTWTVRDLRTGAVVWSATVLQ